MKHVVPILIFALCASTAQAKPTEAELAYLATLKQKPVVPDRCVKCVSANCTSAKCNAAKCENGLCVASTPTYAPEAIPEGTWAVRRSDNWVIISNRSPSVVASSPRLFGRRCR